MGAVAEKPSAERGRALPALFALYLVLLVWIVLWRLEVPYVGGGDLRVIKVVPFASSGGSGASAPFEVIANVILFVPFGLYLRLCAPSWRWWRSVGTLAGASLLLEVAQYVLALGSSDVSDVVANTAGGLVGIGGVAVARRGLGARFGTVMVWVCWVGTVVAVLVVVVIVASPLRYAPPRAIGVVGSWDDARRIVSGALEGRTTAECPRATPGEGSTR